MHITFYNINIVIEINIFAIVGIKWYNLFSMDLIIYTLSGLITGESRSTSERGILETSTPSTLALLLVLNSSYILLEKSMKFQVQKEKNVPILLEFRNMYTFLNQSYLCNFPST